MNSLKQS